MAIQVTYFGVKAKNVVIAATASMAEVDVEFNTMDFAQWGEMKPTTQFGKLPIMKDGDLTIAQSMAIAMHIGRKGNLLGEGDDFSISNMLAYQMEDVFSAFAKGYYGANKGPDTDKYFAEEMPQRLAELEKLVKGDQFTSVGNTVGELNVWSLLNIFLDMYPELLKEYPGLTAFQARLTGHPKMAEGLKKIATFQAWYKKDW